VAMQRRSMRP
jgi:hypothetical protein